MMLIVCLHKNVREAELMIIDTPYEGMPFGNWPRYTIMRGKVVWDNGKLVGSPQHGQYLRREASQMTQGAVQSITADRRRTATWLYR